MAAKKWGLDEPLDYLKCLQLMEGPAMPKGRPLNWGSMRLYQEERGFEDPVLVIKRGCVILVELWPYTLRFLKGHWRSETSFELINLLSPLKLGRQHQTWYFMRPQSVPWMLFTDGCGISTTDVPLVHPYLEYFPQRGDLEAEIWPLFQSYLDKWVEAAKKGEIGPANADPCWECYYYTSRHVDGYPLPIGSEPAGLTHLFEHASKGEIVPSLLWRAIQEMGLNPALRWDNLVGSGKDPEPIRDYLSAYFRRRLGSLSAFHYKAKAERESRVKNRSDKETVPVGAAADAPPG